MDTHKVSEAVEDMMIEKVVTVEAKEVEEETMITIGEMITIEVVEEEEVAEVIETITKCLTGMKIDHILRSTHLKVKT